MSTKTTSHSSGGETETRTYENGVLTDIQHTDDKTGENHSHEACHGGGLGLLGSWTGPRK